MLYRRLFFIPVLVGSAAEVRLHAPNNSRTAPIDIGEARHGLATLFSHDELISEAASKLSNPDYIAS